MTSTISSIVNVPEYEPKVKVIVSESPQLMVNAAVFFPFGLPLVVRLKVPLLYPLLVLQDTEPVP